jgi:pimeloyl-ACP methyl ester carboxylesterase
MVSSDRRGWLRWLHAAAWLAAAAPAVGGASFGGLDFEPCVLAAAGLPRPVEARCTSLSVAEDPASPEGRRIELALAWIPADGVAEPDPVFFIAGGPGQSARDSYPLVAAAFADVHRSRHILLLDQRGTGGSRPLVCRDEEGREIAVEFEELTLEATREITARCRDELQEQADLRFYTTSEAVHDLEAVRVAVGASQVNLVGVSYGTRVAQQYAMRHPQHTRTVLLDSVVPNELALGSEHAVNLQRVLEVQFERCRESTACAGALGDPAALLDTVAGRLRSGGLPPVRYRDPTSGDWREEVPTYDHLAIVLRLYAYTPLTASLLPLVVQRAADEDYGGLLAMARMMVRDLGGQMSFGMQLSVICSEDADEIEARPEADGTLLGNEFVEVLQAQCELWPRGERPEDFRKPLDGELPVLLISGEYDPVTPPRYGDQVVAHLPRGRHLVLRGQGHSLLGAGCMPKLAAQFIEDADALVLDASCLDRLAAPPPFAGLHGWGP